MKNKATKSFCLGLTFLAYAAQAEAHTFGAEGAGLLAGMAHPFIGVDHLLAMLAVGIWAGQLDRDGVWRIPLVFIGMMCVSALMAAYGPALPLLELGIAMSVLILGILVLSAARLPIGMDVLLIGILAIGHGYAHGLEIPEAASELLYGAGFVLATALLHMMGITLGLIARRNQWLTRTGGLALALSGLYLVSAAA
ncbi:MAG: HupE/UreJ family protein [Gammaproteobacteria bacterium]